MDDNQEKRVSEARRVFEQEMQRRGVKFSLKDDGRYKVEMGQGALTVSIENVARELERERDAAIIEQFIDRILSTLETPAWDVAQHHIYWCAERFDHDFGDTLRETVTDTVTRVLVVTDFEHGLITWLTPSHLAKWKVSIDEVRQMAARNLDQLLVGKRLEVSIAANARLGMIPIGSALKASVVFAASFKQFVVDALGWPVLVVIPCRDFVYVIAEADKDMLPRMGPVVQREFRSSGYPITTEVLRISDDGIEAIGAFPE
jgi:hypothetical protein